VRGSVVRLLGERIRAAVDNGGRNQDHKSRLQEEVAGRSDDVLVYEFEATGPDHARTFTATVSLDGEPIATGEGTSKKAAEMSAALTAWTQLHDAVDA